MMATREPLAVVTAVILAIALVAGIVVLVRQVFFGPNTITAYFPTATAIYPGDEVRVSGVKVGKIDSIEPDGTRTKLTLKVDHGVPVPADAKAVIVAQNLVAARYVQLTPAYRKGGGPTMRDGAVIPDRPNRGTRRVGRGQDQLDAPGHGFGPEEPGCRGRRSRRFIDSAANALDGNGDKLRETLAQLSGCGADLRRGQRQHRRHHQEPADLRDRASRQQGADRPVQESAGQCQRARTTAGPTSTQRCPICPSRWARCSVSSRAAGIRPAEQIQRLAEVTQILVDNRLALENVLHITPNAIANFRTSTTRTAGR